MVDAFLEQKLLPVTMRGPQYYDDNEALSETIKLMFQLADVVNGRPGMLEVVVLARPYLAAISFRLNLEASGYPPHSGRRDPAPLIPPRGRGF